MEAAVKGQQPPPEAVIGPTVPGQREAGAAVEEGAGGSGAGVALALEGVRRAFDEAEAFVDKVCLVHVVGRETKDGMDTLLSSGQWRTGFEGSVVLLSVGGAGQALHTDVATLLCFEARGFRLPVSV